MENTEEYQKNAQQPEKVQSDEQEEAEFENPSVDPGFATEGDEEEKEQGDPAANEGDSTDAMNYKNDREHGAYNPKNI